MAILPILAGLGAAGSIIGGIGQSSQASASNALSREQLAMMQRAQNYQFARQGQVDPIFLELLQQSLSRSRSAPRMAGAYGPGLMPLQAAMRGARAPLPVPQLIGSSPTPTSTPGPTAPMQPQYDERNNVGGY